ncbi:class I adenylate-forming enzyme family protein [Lewinella sp. JB7]|uniref:class I adenylate-forming enzyme family protein n=1 Tax=Lewinella sp. JB7 TaxID=2962887 RepID=UPI0020C9F4F1|nr:AMP-binding protein [Lewinella sp. JB7]MCP9234976.1 AMP-binding protein [Lewinella sp. JB7]
MNFAPTDWTARWARYTPDRIAVSDGQESLSYAELHRSGRQLARLLADRGLRKGDRIAVIAENDLSYVLLFVAAQKAGFVLVPINYRLSGREVNSILADADPALIVYQESYHHLLPVARADVPTVGRYELRQLGEAGEGGDTEWTPPESPTATDPIFILYTSGTTGLPKGVLYTHRMLFWNSENTVLSLGIGPATRTLNVMPPFHTGGWNVLTTPLLHRGGYTRLLRRFDAAEVLRLFATERATVFMAVPTMVRLLADDPAFASADLSHLRYLVVGGEPLAPTLIERWHDRGVPIRQGFGMTEVGPNLFSLHEDDALDRKGSIGRPNFYVRTRVVGDDGTDCRPGEAGELWLRGPMTTPGYWRNSAATEKVFDGGWFRTGDVVRRDAEDYFYVVGRIKEMYISGGENVYPAEVERYLETHPAVAEAVVVGVTDPCWGEVGHAYLVLVERHSTTKQEISDYCRLGLAGFKVPKRITLVDALPRNSTGKVDRRALASR